MDDIGASFHRFQLVMVIWQDESGQANPPTLMTRESGNREAGAAHLRQPLSSTYPSLPVAIGSYGIWQNEKG
jgi:hypothetical protein